MKGKFSKKQLLIFAVVFAALGGLLVWRILAATPNAALEAESATLTGKTVKCAASGTSAGASNSNYIILNASACPGTTPPPPPPPPSDSDCLQRTNKQTLTGTVSSYTGSPANGSVVDARSYTVANDSAWLATPGGGSNVCWVGGEFKNTIADSATGSPTNAWATYWHHNGGFTLKNNNQNWIFDGVAIHHTGDAFNISTSGDNFEVRNSHIYDIRDDCLQNDYYLSGSTHDNLFEGCYDGFSSKASAGTSPNGSGKTWTINNNIVYIQPQPSVYKGDAPGSAYLLKWAKPGDGLGTPEHVVFKNNIVRIDKCAFASGSSCGGSFYWPPDVDWSGNSLYWGGSGAVPSDLATWFSSAHGSKMITKAEWDAAVAGWKTAHPGVK